MASDKEKNKGKLEEIDRLLEGCPKIEVEVEVIKITAPSRKLNFTFVHNKCSQCGENLIDDWNQAEEKGWDGVWCGECGERHEDREKPEPKKTKFPILLEDEE